MNTNNNRIVEFKDIQNYIFTIRGLQVMIDRDLAELYNVEQERLIKQLKEILNGFL